MVRRVGQARRAAAVEGTRTEALAEQGVDHGMLLRLPGDHALALEAVVRRLQVRSIEVGAGHADRNLIARRVERGVDRAGLEFLVVVVARTGGDRQVRQDVEIDRGKGSILLVAALGVFTKRHRRATRTGDVERRGRVRRDEAEADVARSCVLGRSQGRAAGRDRLVVPVLVVLDLERFVVGTDDCADALAFGGAHAEFVALVRGADLIRPVAGRRVAVRRRAHVPVVVRPTGALVENAVGRTGVVGVVTLRRDMTGHVGAGVDHLEVANLAVQRPGGVPVIVLAELRHEQGRLQAGQRLIVVGVGLGGEAALGVQTLIRFGDQQVPIRGDLPAQLNAPAHVVDRVRGLFDLRGIVVLAGLRLLRGGHRLRSAQIVGAQIGRLAGEGRGDVVDVAAVVIVIDDRADRQLVLDDRNVDHRVERAVGRTARSAAEAALDAAFELAELGLGGDVTHRTRLRTAAEQRALRAFEHFDALDVGHVDVGVVRRELHRLVIEVDGHVGEAADRAGRLLASEACRQAAHEDRALARAVAREGDVRGVSVVRTFGATRGVN